MDQERLITAGWDTQEQIKHAKYYFDRSYTVSYHDWRLKDSIRRAFLEELVRITDSGKVIRVLDVGCDNGRDVLVLNDLAKEISQVEFVGIDLSEEHIRFATQVKTYFRADNCVFYPMNAEKLCFKDGIFDIVICCEVIEHIPKPEAVIKEIHRVLKPRGIAIVTSPNKGGGYFWKLGRVVNYLLRGKLGKAYDKRLRDMLARGEMPERAIKHQKTEGVGYDHISVKSPKEWIKIFTQNGFRVEAKRRASNFVYGGPFYDDYPFLFGILMALDVIFDKIPFNFNWSPGVLFKIRKSSLHS